MEKSRKLDISVLIPVYGVEKYIERALRSIFNQTKCEGVQFVLVNDCTKDSSMDIAASVISEYPNLNVKIVNHKANSGIAVARQSGLDVAEGEYVIFFDSDDWCEPTMLEDMFCKAKDSDADIVTADYFINRSDAEFYDSVPTPNSGEEALKALLYGKAYWVLWNKLVRRSLYDGEDMRFIDGLNYSEDLLMCAKLFARASKIEYIPKAYLHYMQNGGDAMTNSLSKVKLDNVVSSVKEIEKFLKKNNIYIEMRQALISRKIATKLFLLNNAEGALQRGYAAMYPEVRRYILSYTDTKKYIRYSLLCASRGFVLPFNLIKNFRTFRNRSKASNKF